MKLNFAGLMVKAVVECLIEHGADLKIPFQNGFTPLHIAVAEKKVSVVEYLVKMGAPLDLVDNKGADQCFD